MSIGRKLSRFALAWWVLAGAGCSGTGTVIQDRSVGGLQPQPSAEYGIVIHGGAGYVEPGQMTPEEEASHHEALRAALRVGYEILSAGGSAVDAVTVAVMVLEDDSLFNAGKGSVFASDGTNRLDAGIMDGSTLEAGAVAGLEHTKNPIELARLVMTASPYVFLVGDGAEEFGREHGVEMVDPSYFYTERMWRSLLDDRARQRTGLIPGTAPERAMGTVGAVARDRRGDLAAATSTGGMSNKQYSRVGDVPVIGAGTYASNTSCAVSATGHGEFFIRAVVAHEICARVQYLGESIEDAADAVVLKRLVDLGGPGGVIGIDRNGAITMVANTPSLYRGYWIAGEEPVTALYAAE